MAASGRAWLHLAAERALGLTAVPRGRRAVRAADPGGDAAGGNAAGDVPQPVKVEQPPVAAAKAAGAVAAPMTGEALFPAAAMAEEGAFETPVMPTEEKRRVLEVLDTAQVRVCEKCNLCRTRTQTVFGEGDVDAKLMFVGEGPGENEDLQGRPFVGRAGELLEKQIAAMGLKREQVYIANVVKCRPPGNRAPAPEETLACTPYLVRQIEVIRPGVIVTLGLPATQYLLRTKVAMGKVRGQWHTYRGIAVMPTYHPAYLLRNYTPETRRMVWSDLQKVMERLGLGAARTG